MTSVKLTKKPFYLDLIYIAFPAMVAVLDAVLIIYVANKLYAVN